MSHDTEPGTPAQPPPPAQPARPRPPRCTARRASGRPARPRTPGHGCQARPAKYDLSEDDRQWVTRTVASLGPLTDRQRDILGLLLRTRQ
jgi:hypothetical protein